MLSNFVGSHASDLVYYTNVVLSDRSGATAVLLEAPLEFAILALKRFLVVAEVDAVGYDCRDSRIGHGNCDVITPFSSGV